MVFCCIAIVLAAMGLLGGIGGWLFGGSWLWLVLVAAIMIAYLLFWPPEAKT